MTGQGVDKKQVAGVIAEILSELDSANNRPKTRIGLMAIGSEHARGSDSGQSELVDGALSAVRANPDLDVVMIGPRKTEAGAKLSWITTDDDESAIVAAVNGATESGDIAGAVALHYPFPVGVATIGRVVTPARGKPMLIASTTGTTATGRVESMVKNAVYGIATAKALGIENPTVGILNVDGAPSVNRLLDSLSGAGYAIRFGSSIRADGGSILRGNDILAGAVDVCVTDTLTGNVLMKLFSSWNSGGSYETAGWGYGPSVGQGWRKVISIISRASGAPVIANALLYTADAVSGSIVKMVESEIVAAEKAGLNSLFDGLNRSKKSASAEAKIAAPPAEPTDEEIHGIDVLSIEEATEALWSAGIYAEASMGCTGPVVKVPSRLLAEAAEKLRTAGFI